jgi:hypothetical protein
MMSSRRDSPDGAERLQAIVEAMLPEFGMEGDITIDKFTDQTAYDSRMISCGGREFILAIWRPGVSDSHFAMRGSGRVAALTDVDALS